MMLCEHCSNGGYHGYRRDGYPSTVYFWCPTMRTHSQREECESHIEGEPMKYDKKGELIGGES